MRNKIVAGNWKMNNSYAEALSLAAELKELFKKQPPSPVRTIIAPPFPFLAEIGNCFEGMENVSVAAQNCHHEEKGAFTGEVSAAMVRSTGATHVILGHSERRQYFHEQGDQLLKKTQHALKHALTPIFCIGELLEQRETGKHFETVQEQLLDSVFHLHAEEFSKLILAYEPVWAIGTGLTAKPPQAQEMHAFIRGKIAEKYGKQVAESCSILYGGSCNPSNAHDLFSCPDVDGGLIGGASLKAAEFAAIRKAMINQLTS